MEAIERLPVAEELLRESYRRADFPHWSDLDGNGCSTRKDLLVRQAVAKPDVGPKCTLTGGSWYSYYDGHMLTDTKDVQIDHVVALSEAWRSGGYRWDHTTREQYANDMAPLSLIAVSASSNRRKSDHDPSHWLPDRHLCRYLGAWTATKLRWGLAADPEEVKTLKRQARNCTPAKISWVKAATAHRPPMFRIH